jgi:ligand-binding sensor domain-containing protein
MPPPPNTGLFASLAILLIHLTEPVLGQHLHYEPGEWEFFPSTTTITSASEGPDGLYFSTLDGLIYFDYYGQTLDHLPVLNMGLPSHRLYHVYHDASTNGLWVVYDEGIAYRLATDETWRLVSLLSMPNHFSGRAVTRVGGSFDGIWIDMEGVYSLFHSFSGGFLRQDIAPPQGIVDWNTSQQTFFEPPDLMGWISTGEWSTHVHEFLGPGFLSALPTLVFRDRFEQVWYGTDLGTLFRGDPYTRRLEPHQIGIAPKPVITLYSDNDRIWFADNPFRREGIRPGREETYFLSTWDERISSWRHYSSLVSEAIRDVGVNDMLRAGRELWLATMEGIVLLDTRAETWGFIGSQAGLRDQAVWDLEWHGEEIFAATARGVDRISPSTHRVIPDDSLALSPINEVYCLFSADASVYAGTAAGIYAYQNETGRRWRRISNLPAVSLWVDEEQIFAVAHNRIHVRGLKAREFALFPVQAGSEAKVLEIKGYGSYIWLATSNGAVMIDRRDHRLFTFDRHDGLPSDVVYSVEPGPDWVWMLTRDGVVRFNWSAHFD